VSDERERRGIPFRAMIPNGITALALCIGLTGVSLAIGGEWDKALGSIVLAGVLDGVDGRIARLLRAQSRFGAELDSLSDNIAFGTAPALILFLWSLQTAPRFGSRGSTRASTRPNSRTRRQASIPAFPRRRGPVSPSFPCICG
jgi:phosphatidylserine synthase